MFCNIKFQPFKTEDISLEERIIIFSPSVPLHCILPNLVHSTPCWFAIINCVLLDFGEKGKNVVNNSHSLSAQIKNCIRNKSLNIFTKINHTNTNMQLNGWD